MRKFRKNDDVIVIAGRDKGKRGSIIKVIDDEGITDPCLERRPFQSRD